MGVECWEDGEGVGESWVNVLGNFDLDIEGNRCWLEREKRKDVLD